MTHELSHDSWSSARASVRRTTNSCRPTSIRSTVLAFSSCLWASESVKKKKRIEKIAINNKNKTWEKPTKIVEKAIATNQKIPVELQTYASMTMTFVSMNVIVSNFVWTFQFFRLFGKQLFVLSEIFLNFFSMLGIFKQTLKVRNLILLLWLCLLF